MSEYGAGASIVQHAQDPAQPEARGRFHPEEYQCLYHEGYWAALRTRPYVWAKFIWCLHDFASDGRDEGDHPGRNDKGLVTYDRKVMKDAYYFYKANWSEAAVLHITSSRFNDRRDPVTSVKVYSNATQVELEVDGKPIGTLSDAAGTRVFEWRGVRLAPGENRIAARARIGGRDESDSCVWTLSGP
jgi:beta-galactosidase